MKIKKNSKKKSQQNVQVKTESDFFQCGICLVLIRSGETGTHLSSMAAGWSIVDLPDDIFIIMYGAVEKIL